MNTRTTTLPRALLLLCLILPLTGQCLGEEPIPPKPQTIVWSLGTQSPFGEFDSPLGREFLLFNRTGSFVAQYVGTADLLSSRALAALSGKGLWGVVVGPPDGWVPEMGIPVTVSEAIDSVRPFVPDGVQFNCKPTFDDVRTLCEKLPGCKYFAMRGRDKVSDALVAELAKLHSLSSLDINASDLTDDGIRELGSISSLKALQLYSDGHKFSSRSLSECLSRLTSLRYVAMEEDCFGADVVVALSRLKSMETLLMTVDGVGSDAAQLLRSYHGKDLTLMVSSKDSPEFTVEKGNDWIEALGFSGFHFTCAQLESLQNCSKLRYLAIADSVLPDGISGFPLDLTCLFIGRSRMPRELPAFLGQMPSLKSLALQPVPEDSSFFKGLIFPPGLKKLSVVLPDPANLSQVISKIESLSDLESLWLDVESELSDDEFRTLAKLHNLRNVFLSCKSCTLAGVCKLTTVEDLTVFGQCSPGKADSVEMSKLSVLRSVFFQSLETIPDGFWDALAKMPALEKIQVRAPLPQAELNAKRAALHASNPNLKFIGLCTSLMPPK